MWIWLGLPKDHRPSRSILATLLVLGLLMSLSGCTRRFFRRRADAEVDEILCEKDKYPQWKLNDYYVYPHPLSRFADPTDPDRPPMPPDDPASWDLSPHPQRPLLKGYGYWQGTGYLELMRRWDAENRAALEQAREAAKEETEGEAEPMLPGEEKTFTERAQEIEKNIDAELAGPITSNQPLPVSLEAPQPSVNKPFLLNLAQVTELGFLNSPQFQTERENLYLTALAVTAERFAFIAQPFVTEQLIRQRAGSQTGAKPLNGWLSNATAGFTKSFSTGALLLFNFANQTIYNLGRSGNTVSLSTINFDIVQPFLAGGGRAIALEPLTQAERDLVYAIRQFYRFRQEYYAFFAVGQSTTFIPGVGAGVVSLLPSTVSQPFAFVPGPSALPLVSNPATVQVAPTAPLGAVLNSGVLITPQGYLSAILERTQLINSYKNIQSLQRFYRILDVYLQGGLINLVQRGSVEQSLLSSYETVLGAQVSYRVSLDQLKQQLGLPLTVPIDVAPGPLQPMINIVEAYEKLFISHQRVVNTIDLYFKSEEANLLRGRMRRLLERTALLRGTQSQQYILRNLPHWENFAKDKAWNERKNSFLDEIFRLRRDLSALREKEAKTPGERLPEAEERRKAELKFELDLVEYELAQSWYEREEWKTEKNEIVRSRLAREQFFAVYRAFLTVIDHAYVERQGAVREIWPELPPVRAKGVDVIAAPEDEALLAVEQACFENRVDLMNVRAQLTDAWRKIRVAANALMGTFNVDYHLSSTTPATAAKPFAFAGSRTTHQLIFTGQLPLVRILQRNNYRSTLINFQQSRRSLLQFEDQLLFNVRFDLRQLRIGANTYQRVEKRRIELGYTQVDQALQAFNQPQAPSGADAVLAGLVGPVGRAPMIGDPAALTNQLLGTQGALVAAQNDLYSVWIGYQIYRTDLYRDMGIMPLDNRGVWIDADATANQPADNRPAAGQQPPANAPEQLPPARPEPAAQSARLEATP